MASLEMLPSTEAGQKTDAPTLILQSVLDNRPVLKELLTNGPNRDSILADAKQQIDSLDPQEKMIFLQKTFAVLSDPEHGHQDKRDAALELLDIMDLKSIQPKELTTTYVKAVCALREKLNQDSDPYGEIHMLLEAGKTIAPFIKNFQRITQVWRLVANTFPRYEQNGDDGKDRQKILNDIREIRQLIQKKFSELDSQVLILAKEGLQDSAIAAQLNVKREDIQESKSRLSGKGLMCKPI